MSRQLRVFGFELTPRVCTEQNCPYDFAKLQCGKEGLCTTVMNFERCSGESRDYFGVPVEVPSHDGNTTKKHYLLNKTEFERYLDAIDRNQSIMLPEVYQIKESEKALSGKYNLNVREEKDRGIVRLVLDSAEKFYTGQNL